MRHPSVTAEHPDATPEAASEQTRIRLPGAVVLIAGLGGLPALVCPSLGSTPVGIVSGLAVLLVALPLFGWFARHPRTIGPADGSRRRFLQAGLGGVALVGVGTALGRAADEAL